MNDCIKNLLERRSIRAYRPELPKDEDLELIVKCGMYAATGMGRQPWFFTIVKDRAYLDDISAANRAVHLAGDDQRMREMAAQPDYDNFRGAPCAIIVSGEDSEPGLVDCANATENMALAAHALGLGSCYIQSFSFALDRPEYQYLVAKLQLPEGYKPYFALSVGYADEDPQPAPRKENCVNRIG